MSPFPQPPCEDSCALRCRGRCQLATHPAYVLLGRCTKRWLVVIHERLRQGPSDSALRTGTRCPSFSRASGSILRQGAVLERHLISNNNNNNNNCICTATTSPESAGYRGCTTRLRSSGITCWWYRCAYASLNLSISCMHRPLYRSASHMKTWRHRAVSCEFSIVCFVMHELRSNQDLLSNDRMLFFCVTRNPPSIDTVKDKCCA
jgi:hypothetical protein